MKKIYTIGILVEVDDSNDDGVSLGQVIETAQVISQVASGDIDKLELYSGSFLASNIKYVNVTDAKDRKHVARYLGNINLLRA